MKTQVSITISLLALLGFACSGKQQTDASVPLVVAAAANVQFAMAALEKAFEQSSGNQVEVILSSSGKLTTQIKQGAPYDVFVSADTKYPEALVEAGKAAGQARIYAYGSLVLWSLSDSIGLNADLKGLDNAGIRKIAIANPRTAPYGEQSMIALERAGLVDWVRSRLVYSESIAQTNQYVLSGACQIGFTAKAVVVSPELSGKGRWVAVDPALYSPIAQAALVTLHGQRRHPEASQAFLDFLLSAEGRKILERYGYQLP